MTGTDAPLDRAASARDLGATSAGERLTAMRADLCDGLGEPGAARVAAAYERASRLLAAGGGTDHAFRPAATLLAARSVSELAAEGLLSSGDALYATTTLAEACGLDPVAAQLDFFRAFAADRSLLELPPDVATETVLRVLLDLRLVSRASLWRRGADEEVECLLALGGEPGRSERTEARTALGSRPALRVVSRPGTRSAPVVRLGRRYAALVAEVDPRHPRTAVAFLREAAAALGLVLERRHLLERAAEREQALVGASERRLVRLGFDLHDGPIQDVLALAADVRYLRDQAYPFFAEEHREKLHGRFEDVLGRLGELDRHLRELAHSLESKSIVSRPLGEVLHRELDAFRERSSIEATLEVRGDPDWLTPSQRIATFRAVQEALSNIREHSDASHVDVRVRVRRASIEVRIRDDGSGFEVERALARAAQHGRLGLVGIGERVRMLGGTFDVESRPGGPTTLTLVLARWAPPPAPAGNGS